MVTSRYEEIITSGLWQAREHCALYCSKQERELMIETEQVIREYFDLPPICDRILTKEEQMTDQTQQESE